MYEIERKYLVKNDEWMKLVVKKKRFIQGYISPNVRVRLFTDDKKTDGRITIKSDQTNDSISRMELEYDIPRKDAELIIDTLCKNSTVYKTRHHLSLYNCDDHYWTVDVYAGDNEGVVVAEIEMNDEKQKIKLPDWIDREVTFDGLYNAASLAFLPFNKWEAMLDKKVNAPGLMNKPELPPLKDLVEGEITEFKRGDTRNRDPHPYPKKLWHDLFNGA